MCFHDAKAEPWTPTSGPSSAHVKCTISAAGSGLDCVSSRPLSNGTQISTFAWQAFPPCMLVNDMQLPAPPMRATVPAQAAGS